MADCKESANSTDMECRGVVGRGRWAEFTLREPKPPMVNGIGCLSEPTLAGRGEDNALLNVGGCSKS